MTSPTIKRKLRRSAPCCHISLPSTSTLPEVGRLMPLKWLISVDFPLPVEPIMPTKSPSSTLKEMLSSAVTASGIPGL